MLGKLLKYEIPAVGRKLAPMYLAWLAASVLLGITTGRIESPSGLIIIPVLVYFSVTIAVFVMAIVLIIQRYYNSLFGEAYPEQSHHGSRMGCPDHAGCGGFRNYRITPDERNSGVLEWRTGHVQLG